MRHQTPQNLSDDGRPIIQIGSLKQGAWARDEDGPAVYRVEEPGRGSTVVHRLGGAEPIERIAPGTQVVVLAPEEVENFKAKHEMLREFATANSGRLERLRNRNAPVVLSDQPAGGPTPAPMFNHQSDCPQCGKVVWVTSANKFLPHGPARQRCPQSGQQDRRAA
jgi:hypothetical protein